MRIKVYTSSQERKRVGRPGGLIKNEVSGT